MRPPVTASSAAVRRAFILSFSTLASIPSVYLLYSRKLRSILTASSSIPLGCSCRPPFFFLDIAEVTYALVGAYTLDWPSGDGELARLRASRRARSTLNPRPCLEPLVIDFLLLLLSLDSLLSSSTGIGSGLVTYSVLILSTMNGSRGVATGSSAPSSFSRVCAMI